MSQPRTKSFQIELDQLDAIKAWAAKSGKSDSEVIRTALDEGDTRESTSRGSESRRRE